jgi:zinc transport system substrate-binding protein
MRLSIAIAVLAMVSSAGLALAQSLPTNVPASMPTSRPAGKNLKVLCSIFPVYLFTKNVAAGSNLQVDLMLPANLGCPHDYALTPQDMHKIAAADLMVINGQNLEEFAGPAISKANPKIKIIDASADIKDLIQMKDEDGDAGLHDDSNHHHSGINPHLFAAPRSAARMAATIAAELAQADPENAALYAANAKAFADKMEKLADDFAAAARTFADKKIVTEHAVFDYLARDAGLDIVAVVEESPGQEPSAFQMLDIIKTIKASGATAVFTEPQYSAKVAQTIAKEAGVKVASLDPVAGGPEGAALDYYEQTMRANLETLKKVLGDKSR